uniref:Cilia and flagella associated protein 251 n=1 Tax=Equus caballus TaxID=9796 RepID=F6VNX8_HORSE
MEAISVGRPPAPYPLLLAAVMCGSEMTGGATLLGRVVVSAHRNPPPSPGETRSPKIADRLPSTCPVLSERMSPSISALEAAVSLGGENLTPFYGLVSGGREGKFYRELEDYFYYSQLRSQGIDTMETRKVSEHICLSELPFVMRAIGFYPSEEKIEDMFNEIKFGEYVDTGKLIDKINLPDFLKVYLNHRPPFGNTMSGIQRSFNILGFTNSNGKKAIRREDFLKLLLTKGEHMTEEEMSDCFASLFGLNPEGWKSEPAASSVKGSEICFEEELPDEITAEIFTTEILGLTVSEDFRQDPVVGTVIRNV